MELTPLVQRLCYVEIKRLMLVTTVLISAVVIFQYFTVPDKRMQLSIENGRYHVVFSNQSNSTGRFEEDEVVVESSIDYDLPLDDTITMDAISSVLQFKGSNSSNLKSSSANDSKNVLEVQDINANANAIESIRESAIDPSVKKLSVHQISISQMNSLLTQSSSFSPSSKLKSRLKKYSARDRELLSAKLEIENAPNSIYTDGLQSYVFQNISQFIRSYQLMERVLKVYVYKEGEKPIFHQPKMRGIYSSEGWFMKLMEGNKKFLVRDPKKAHLFYMPFSSMILRNSIDGGRFRKLSDLEMYLQSYVDLIAGKYRFWNRTGGSDHFLAACHDWSPRMTRNPMGNCIKALCNANAAKGFKIGKDTSLPVTYVRSSQNPTKFLGGNPPSERRILAFFAGSMHGYLRPILLRFLENKAPDMKIFGRITHENVTEGKRIYREYMKNSKYCVCARGYEVHTPRIVEAILYECVPVIVSDNYVPPFFEVLNWEAFAVFVKERDVPNLREILVSIPEEDYLRMQRGVKMAQRHFVWHKNPEKYDLFHMILHSVWHNRILQLKHR